MWALVCVGTTGCVHWCVHWCAGKVGPGVRALMGGGRAGDRRQGAAGWAGMPGPALLRRQAL